jgi:hypothetical protein
MDVFELRERLTSDYSSYIRSFIRITDERIRGLVASHLDQGLLSPDPLIQLNPSFQYAETIDDLVSAGVLHSQNSRAFRRGRDKGGGKTPRLYQHQADAIALVYRLLLKMKSKASSLFQCSGMSHTWLVSSGGFSDRDAEVAITKVGIDETEC